MAVCQFTYSIPENLHLAAFFATTQHPAAGAYHVR